MKKSRTPLVVANWKMNPATALQALALWKHSGVAAAAAPGVKVVVCPPLIYLDLLEREKSVCALGAQNFFAGDAETAHTGEISTTMLANIGVSHVLVGHSERRTLGETNTLINQKLLAALKEEFVVILCIGEDRRDTDGFYLTMLSRQLEEGLAKVPKKGMDQILIAYEPLWAIGKDSKGPAAPADVLETVLYIRRILTRMWGAKDAEKVRVLYGGSVDGKNAREFVSEGGVDGLLVGRQSLAAKSFSDILSSLRNA